MRINLGIRRRLAPLLENDRRRIELMNALLFSLPGTPVIYYGDEIGMGDNFYLGDRNGVRTPMQWSGDRNAGFSKANPQKLYLPAIIDPEYHYEAINVETQQNNPHSLLWWMKRMLGQRKQSRALGRGSLQFVEANNRGILAFVRTYQQERILVVANLSRFPQCTEINLSQFAGSVPTELFGKTQFPTIGDRPYFLSLAAHAFYWFALQPREAVQETLRIQPGEPPVIRIPSFDRVFTQSVRATLNGMLPAFVRGRRWFRSKGRTIRTAEVAEVIPFPKSNCYVLLIRVEFSDGEPDIYTLPLYVNPGDQPNLQFVLARLETADGSRGLLASALHHREFCEDLLTAILKRRRYAGEHGELTASHTRSFRTVWGQDRPALEPTVSRVDQDNTTLFYGDRFALKVLRKVEEGPHPELEIGAMLTQLGFPYVPPLAGSLEYRNEDGETMVAGVLHGAVRQGIEAWQYTINHLGLFFEHAVARGPSGPPQNDFDNQMAHELIGTFLETVRLFGTRTAELHAALSSHAENPAFAPEPYTDFYRHGLYHGMLARQTRTADLLRERLDQIPEIVRGDATLVLEKQAAIRARYRYLRDERIAAARIRIHGDFHLAQILYTGKDVMFIDFEGDPGRPLSERRIKRSPLQDVAGMLDSFYHACHGVLFGEAPGVIPKPETLNALERWAKFWYRTVSAEYLAAYLAAPGIKSLVPANGEQIRMMLRIFLLDLAQRKLGYELRHAPERIRVPAHAILELLEAV